MSVYDWSKCKRETLEQLAEAAHEAAAEVDSDGPRKPGNFERTMKARIDALAAARAEATPKLRTRAEVDRDIADAIRRAPLPTVAGGYAELIIKGVVAERLNALRAEPLAPEPEEAEPSGFYAELDADPPGEEPEACSCDEALALRKKLNVLQGLIGLWRRRAAQYPEGSYTDLAIKACAVELERAIS